MKFPGRLGREVPTCRIGHAGVPGSRRGVDRRGSHGARRSSSRMSWTIASLVTRPAQCHGSPRRPAPERTVNPPAPAGMAMLAASAHHLLHGRSTRIPGLGDDRWTALAARAREVLDGNWPGRGRRCRSHAIAAEWNWNSAFIAIGRSWYDEGRAQQELRSLLGPVGGRQGPEHHLQPEMSPRTPTSRGPTFWQSSTRSPSAPRGVETSGITQPPIHARAALEMHRHARDVDASKAFLMWLYPRLVAEHAYLSGRRDPTGIGLTAFVHPWESGLDNSPAWNRDLSEMVDPRGRHPAVHPTRPRPWRSEGPPTNEAYDRFVFLAARYRDSGYDDAVIADTVPFVMAGPMYRRDLPVVTARARRDRRDRRSGRASASRGRRARPCRTRGRALGPRDEALLRPRRDPTRTERGGHDRLVRPAAGPGPAEGTARCDPGRPAFGELPSRSGDQLRRPELRPAGEGFDERRYWRGPVWINTNWLLLSACGSARSGALRHADRASRPSPRRRCRLPRVLRPVRWHRVRHDSFGWTAALACCSIFIDGAHHRA